jgi:hypothetical protein
MKTEPLTERHRLGAWCKVGETDVQFGIGRLIVNDRLTA